MRVLIIDNYDSFTYNLVHLVSGITGEAVTVYMNDEIDFERLPRFHRIILSPGPGLPSESGQLTEVIRQVAGKVPVLGVCLGHQAIGEVFGGRLHNLDTVFHGLATKVIVERDHVDRGIFKGVSPVFEAGRYHSWVVAGEDLPADLVVTARDESGVVMAMKHRRLEVEGVQFHPESVMTPDGKQILRNWLSPEFNIKTDRNEPESMRNH